MSQQINLFNPIFLKKEKYFSALTMAQALALILVGCAVLGGYANYQLTLLGKEAQATKTQLGAVQAQLKKISASYTPRQKSKSIEDAIAEGEAEVASLQRVAGMLKNGELGNTKGYAEYMRALSRQAVNGLWLTHFTIQGAGTDIGLQGRALQPDLVPAYISRLKREPVMQGKSFAALEMQVPRAEGGDNASPSTPRDRMKPYIEFSLQSSGTLKESAELSGVKSK